MTKQDRSQLYIFLCSGQANHASENVFPPPPCLQPNVVHPQQNVTDPLSWLQLVRFCYITVCLLPSLTDVHVPQLFAGICPQLFALQSLLSPNRYPQPKSEKKMKQLTWFPILGCTNVFCDVLIECLLFPLCIFSGLSISSKHSNLVLNINSTSTSNSCLSNQKFIYVKQINKQNKYLFSVISHYTLHL